MPTAVMDKGEKADAAEAALSERDRSRRFLPNDPLDAPYPEEARPRYYNPHHREGGYRVHAVDSEGRDHPVGKVRFRSGLFMPMSPREEMWTREYLSRLLNGNNPDRWKGDDLPDDERFVCRDCPFTSGNHRVGIDHMRFHKHQQRV